MSIIKKLTALPEWARYLAVVVVTATGVSLLWLFRAPQPVVPQAVVVSEDASAQALVDAVNAASAAMKALQEAEYRTQTSLLAIRESMDARLQKSSDDLKARLQSLSADTAAALERHQEEIRRSYEDILLTPERIGPVFDDAFRDGPGGTCPID
jgi:hypothetical protein